MIPYYSLFEMYLKAKKVKPKMRALALKRFYWGHFKFKDKTFDLSVRELRHMANEEEADKHAYEFMIYAKQKFQTKKRKELE